MPVRAIAYRGDQKQARGMCWPSVCINKYYNEPARVCCTQWSLAAVRTLLPLNTIRFNVHATMFMIIVVVAILCGARRTLEAPATGSLQLRL